MNGILDITLITDEIVNILLFGFWGFLLAMLITPIYTHFAFKHQWWKKQRTTSTTGEKAKVFQKLHAAKHKRNIPTMAGLIMLAAIVIVTMFNLSREQTWLPLAALIGAGAVGLLDDIINLRGSGKGVAGLSSRYKFLAVLAVTLLGGWYFFSKLGYDSFYITFIGEVTVGWLLIPIFAFVVLATANAVNISDGLDGLAGGLLANSFAAYGAIALLQGNYGIAGFCMTVVGTLFAYVWFNIHPARFFMGDVGSFSLGTALGVVAMLTDAFILLPVIGLMFVIEAGSSSIQILSKKLRNGKKIFISAPIHHHFEALGWPETKVTMRFWVISQIAAVIGLILALVGGHI